MVALIVLSGLAAIPTVAALVGQQGGGSNDDYLMRPLELSHSVAKAVVLGSAASVVVLAGRADALSIADGGSSSPHADLPVIEHP